MTHFQHRREFTHQRRPSLWLRGAAFVAGMYAALILTIGAVHWRHEASDEMYHAGQASFVAANANTKTENSTDWLTKFLLVTTSDYPRESRYPQIRQGRTFTATHTDLGIESPFIMPMVLIILAAGSGIMLAIGRPWAKFTLFFVGIRQNEGPATFQTARILASRRQHQVSAWIWLAIGSAGGITTALAADFSAVWLEFLQGEVQIRRGIFTPPSGIPRAFLLLSVPDVIAVLCWTFFGCFLLSATPGQLAMRERRQRLGTHCHACGYPRPSRYRATDNACPECGSRPLPSPPHRPRRTNKRITLKLALMIAACLILFLASPHIVITLWKLQ